ncbi:sugar transporter SWEET1-like [Amphiura filiformis]|uniref:sugar transporter SWEET1-like n=1 Tax=Amphiura filiformis TaxID=82378 RepID=UPI003B214BCC
MELHEWIEFLSWACIVITLLGYMAGIPTCYDIFTSKSTNAIPFLPFLFGFIANVGCLWYGIRIWDFPTLVCNTTGSALYTVYVAVYLIYTNKKASTFQLSFLTAIGLISFYLYLTQLVVSQADITYQLGLSIATFILIWNVSPILEIREVMHTKSSECLSPTLSLAMLMSSIAWGLYGHAIDDIFIAGPCIPGIFSGFIQLLLWYTYPATKTVKTD